MKPFFITIPHSGERVPDEATWLQGLVEPVLMCDVDRYVDRLYRPVIEQLGLAHVVAQWHRYAADLNRLPGDIDSQSVEGNANPPGTFPIGLHWSVTTTGHPLIKNPMSQQLHDLLVQKYHRPFHEQVEKLYSDLQRQGFSKIYQLDAHSMPSMGTKAHRDPGEKRAEVVVSDVDGTSCEKRFADLVIAAYKQAGFEVAYNWPYKGGRVTQTYGRPESGQHAIQVELNRALYMDEVTKKIKDEQARQVQMMISEAIRLIYNEL